MKTSESTGASAGRATQNESTAPLPEEIVSAIDRLTMFVKKHPLVSQHATPDYEIASRLAKTIQELCDKHNIDQSDPRLQA